MAVATWRQQFDERTAIVRGALGSMWVKLGQIPIAKIRGITPPALKLIIGHLKAASE
jgi:hypothetical protein